MKFYFLNDLIFNRYIYKAHPERYFLSIWDKDTSVFINRDMYLCLTNYTDENFEKEVLSDFYLDEISDDIKCNIFIRDLDIFFEKLPSSKKWKIITKNEGKVYKIRENIFGICDKRYKFGDDIIYIIDENDNETIELAKNETSIEHRFAIGDCSKINVEKLEEVFLPQNSYFTKKKETIHYNLKKSSLWNNQTCIDEKTGKPVYFLGLSENPIRKVWKHVR